MLDRCWSKQVVEQFGLSITFKRGCLSSNESASLLPSAICCQVPITNSGKLNQQALAAERSKTTIITDYVLKVIKHPLFNRLPVVTVTNYL